MGYMYFEYVKISKHGLTMNTGIKDDLHAQYSESIKIDYS